MYTVCMSIVTKTGDKGMTGLFGGKRIAKDDARIEAYGTVDELNAALGCAIAHGLEKTLEERMVRLQHLLFRVGADLAAPLDTFANVQRIEGTHVAEVEGWIREGESVLPAQQKFILPGGSGSGAMLHLARTLCRRAERRVLTLAKREAVGDEVKLFLNRLSDALFLASRMQNVADKKPDAEVHY